MGINLRAHLAPNLLTPTPANISQIELYNNHLLSAFYLQSLDAILWWWIGFFFSNMAPQSFLFYTKTHQYRT